MSFKLEIETEGNTITVTQEIKRGFRCRESKNELDWIGYFVTGTPVLPTGTPLTMELIDAAIAALEQPTRRR
jgi:hypothetical protein